MRMSFTSMPSLCESCYYLHEVRTSRSRFLLCELSRTNEDYPKYPPQPVSQCDGYLPKERKEFFEFESPR